MGIEKQRQQRSQRQGDIGKARTQAAGRGGRQQQLPGRHGGEDLGVTAQLGRNDHDRGQHRDIDQQILHHRDQGGAAQAAGIGENSQHDEGRDQGHIDLAQQRQGHGMAEAQGRDHHLHAHQLQRDIGHHRHQPRQGNGQRQPAMAEAAAHEIGGGDIAMGARHRPQPWESHEQHRIHQRRIGHGEESGRPGAEQQRRHRDEGIGGVEIAAQKKPGDQGAEAAPAQAPLRQLRQVGMAPARTEQAQERHEHEQDQEHDQRHGTDRQMSVHLRRPSSNQ